MKRYWLFEYTRHNEGGGMSDYIGDYNTIEEAETARTGKFNTAIKYINIEELWKKDMEELLKEIPPNKDLLKETTEKYRRMSKTQVEELKGREINYYILDIQERRIVQGWNGYEVIEETPLDKFQ